MIRLALAAGLACSAHVSEAWVKSGWNLATLPVKPCIMQSDTGAYRCSRKDGCAKCGPYPCPELGIKGAS
jgi:hypothetical protein